MKCVDVWYCIGFGGGDWGDWVEDQEPVSEKDYAAYLKVNAEGKDPEAAPRTAHMMRMLYKRVGKTALQDLLDNEDETALECLENGQDPFEEVFSFSVSLEAPEEYGNMY